MSEVHVEQKTYHMPPVEGFTIAHFLTVADLERSARFYATVFGGRILSTGDGDGSPSYPRSRTPGSSSTSGAVQPPTNQR